MSQLTKLSAVSALLISSTLVSSCARVTTGLGGGTGTGNPGITISSQGYNTNLAQNSQGSNGQGSNTNLPATALLGLLPSSLPSTTPAVSNAITSLKLCVSELRFLTNNGINIGVPKTELGQIDLGDGSKGVTWGTVNVPAGDSIAYVYVESEHENACGSSAYTLEANGMDVTAELEFHFAFTAPVTIGGSSTVTFSLVNLTNAVNQALQAGQFDNTHIGNYIDSGLVDGAYDH